MNLRTLMAVGLLLTAHRCKSWDTVMSNDMYISTRNSSNAWRKGVMDYYHGCQDVLEFFPEATFEYGRTLKTSVKTHVDYLGVLTTYNSTIISEGSKNSLKAISMLAKFGKSREHLLMEFRLVAPRLSSAYRDIIWTLSPFIGELVGPINEAISQLEDSIIQVLFEYENRFEERKQERCEKIAIEEMMKKVQILLNRITLVAETALDDLDICDDVLDSLKIAVLISNHYLIAVQGTGSSIASELISESENIPPSHATCFQAMDPLLKVVASSISSMTSDNKQFTREWLAILVEETKKFNEAVDRVLGPFKDRGFTVAQIKQNFANSLRKRWEF
ncbi:uncharacterized protein LOC119080932 [Bradysia coprophila]|uniref:uncharacterized protein LOC119080932 n=1 Tax=Bradysia coprophila TaxID=38358 RepID=UPI00187DB6EB|nr:uncharacterized protein LOC119080932 [Bradysia coprophila]